MARRSRLSKKYEAKSRNTLILSILGIAAILFLLFRYGIPLISDASFLFGRATSTPKADGNKKDEDKHVPSPNLDSLPKATKNQNINVTGTSLSGLKIVLYLNGSREDEKDVSEDGSFEFNIDLTDGENIIKAKTIRGTNESDFSNSRVVVYKKSGPELTIENPSDDAQISGSNPIEIKGKTDSDSNVLINDFQAIINSEGAYSYFLTLKGGDNEIKVIATDLAGNQTQKTIHVNYSQ